MVGIGRRLTVSFLKWLPVPYPVSFLHIHVIHVNGNPYIACSIGNVIVNTVANNKIIGFKIAILNVVDTWRVHRREIKLYIVVFEIIAPRLNAAGKNLTGFTICIQLKQGGFGKRFILLVELNNRHFGLSRKIADLREANIWFPYPTIDGIGFNSPG